MNGGKLIIRTRLIERLNKELKHKKIVYFGASLGWGKTTAVRQYLDSNNYEYIRLFQKAWSFPSLSPLRFPRPCFILSDERRCPHT